jgi:hypothetical protein
VTIIASAEQQAGDRAGQEHPADREAGERADDDHRHRGRDHRPDGRGGGGDRGGEVGRVARPLHAGDHHAADRGGVGDRGARDAAEQQRARDVRLAEPAAHPADEGVGEAHDPPGDAAGVHQVAGEDEAGDRQQHEDVDAGVHRCGIVTSGMPW